MNKEAFKAVCGEEKIERFEKYCDFLLESNKKFNITAITDRDEVRLKHFVDSLSGKKYFPERSKVLEIGSGGGFPSVPLKINDESLMFTLVESNAKKCGFLTEVGKLLNFDDFEVVNARAEEFALKNKEAFDVATARAVAPSAVLCELTLPSVKIGGHAVYYKSFSDEEISAAKRAAEKLGCRLNDVREYELEGVAGKRCLIIIEKIAKTPDGYPRSYNKIVKKPL